MKKMYLMLLVIFLTSNAYAGRSGNTKIKSIIIKPTYVEIFTVNGGGCGSTSNRWYLQNSNTNYKALLSGFLVSKMNGNNVDIIGDGSCGTGENISWAYVMQ